MKRALFIASWVVASIIATSVAMAAVSSVTANVTDSPSATLAGDSFDDDTTTSTTIPDDDDDDDTTTSTTIPGEDDDDTTTSTTAAPIPTETVTYQLVGGWVRVTVGQGFVDLEGAAPSPGFSMKLESESGTEVRVRFESNDHRSEFEAKWEGGELEIEIEEKSGDDDSSDDSHDDSPDD